MFQIAYVLNNEPKSRMYKEIKAEKFLISQPAAPSGCLIIKITTFNNQKELPIAFVMNN